MDLPDHYHVLGVDKTATTADIKKAYYRLALVHHPDKKAPGQQVDAAEFRAIHEAYALLSDEVKRAKYDKAVMFEEQKRADKDRRAALSRKEARDIRRTAAQAAAAESKRRTEESRFGYRFCLRPPGYVSPAKQRAAERKRRDEEVMAAYRARVQAAKAKAAMRGCPAWKAGRKNDGSPDSEA